MPSPDSIEFRRLVRFSRYVIGLPVMILMAVVRAAHDAEGGVASADFVLRATIGTLVAIPFGWVAGWIWARAMWQFGYRDAPDLSGNKK